MLPRTVAALLSILLLALSAVVLWWGIRIGWAEVAGIGGRFTMPSMALPTSLDFSTWMKVPRSWMMASLAFGATAMFSVNIELLLRSLATLLGAGERLEPIPMTVTLGGRVMLSLFLPLFLVFLMLGLPIMFGLIAAPAILLWFNGQERDIVLLYRNVYNGMDSFPLMAIPFFMLAGELMNRAGITLRLVEFSQAVIGHLRGGLAHVNILSSMLFAGLSGSAVADVSALGSMLIPAMEKQGLFAPLCRRRDRGIGDHWSDHPAVGDHDHLCLCDGRERRSPLPRRHCPGNPHRHRPDAGGAVARQPREPAAGDAAGDMAPARPCQHEGLLAASDTGHYHGWHPRRHLHPDRGISHRPSATPC